MPGTVCKNILVIDDEEAMRDCICFFLMEHGYSITLCSSGTEGVQECKNKIFDLVITDIMMPEMDGFETIVAIQKINPDIKILAISGFAMKDTLLYTAEQYGAIHSLQKPFTKEGLVKVVSAILKIPKST